MIERDTTVEALMITPVETVAPDATLPEAARVLDAKGIGSLVVDEDRLDDILTPPGMDVYPYPRRRQSR